MHPAFLQSSLRRAALAAAIVAGAISATVGRRLAGVAGPLPRRPFGGDQLPSKWSPAGDNLAWRIPIGSRSAPVAFGNRIYINSPSPGDPTATQERLIAIDAETGKVVWERRFSLYLSDVPQHRASWASPAVDPETGNIYLFTVAAAADLRVAGRQGAVGPARSPTNTAPSPRTAAAPPRRSSRATRSFSTR